MRPWLLLPLIACTPSPAPDAGPELGERVRSLSQYDDLEDQLSDYWSDGDFAGAVAASGPWIVVGEPFDDAVPMTGSVHIYKSDGNGGWVAHQLIEGTYTDEAFGYAVAIHDDMLLIGAPDYSFGDGRAELWVYNAMSDAFVLERTLVPSGTGTEFGAAVDLHNGMAVIGAPSDGSGVVWGYEDVLDSNVGSDRISPPSSLLRNDFGISVSIDPTRTERPRIAIGATNGLVTGEVYLYQFASNLWAYQDTVSDGLIGIGEEYGASVSLYGNTLAVGAPDSLNLGGRVFVYEDRVGNWTQVHSASGLGELGAAVHLVDGNTLVVGSPTFDFGQGQVRLYEQEPTGWAWQDSWTSSGHGSLGRSLAYFDGTLVAGAPDAWAGYGAAVLLEIPGPPPCDSDEDGYESEACGGTDCDDNDERINPAAVEVCEDGADNDCDGFIDNGRDTVYPDADGDGYGDTRYPEQGCPDPNRSLVPGDCDDAEPLYYPGADEVCNNGIDENCDGVDGDLVQGFADNDGDGWGSAAGRSFCDALPSGYVSSSQVGDCDDNNAAINPDSTESCNGVDDNCNGVADEGISRPLWPDNDGDGWGDSDQVAIETCADPSGYAPLTGDCDDNNGTIYPGAPEACDGFDSDCDGAFEFDELDLDGDGVRGCDGDCNDGDATIFPGAPEGCNGVDNDCDGLLDPTEVDGDGDGHATCEGDCDDNNRAVKPGQVEQCDGIDNNCDGNLLPDEIDADGDGVLICAGDCDDANVDTFPGATELCDGLDNDCDQIVPREEIDDDNDGMSECMGDCDDAEPTVFPGATELCDGLDNNCDGEVDPTRQTAYLDNDLDGFGGPEETVICGEPGDGVSTVPGDCDDTDPGVNPDALETPDDGIDQDCQDGDAVTCYVDEDADLYGGDDTAVAWNGDCFTSGYAPVGGDCDDEDPDIHPDAEEIPFDGIDQDCDGNTGQARLTGGSCSTTGAPLGGWLALVLPLWWRRSRRRI